MASCYLFVLKVDIYIYICGCIYVVRDFIKVSCVVRFDIIYDSV